MSPEVRPLRATAPVFALLILGGCTEAERILNELPQQIAGNQIVPLPRFAALAAPAVVAAK